MALSNGLTMAKVVPLIHMGRQPGKANVCRNSVHGYLGSISYVETIKTETSSMYHQFLDTWKCCPPNPLVFCLSHCCNLWLRPEYLMNNQWFDATLKKISSRYGHDGDDWSK